MFKWLQVDWQVGPVVFRLVQSLTLCLLMLPRFWLVKPEHLIVAQSVR
jgi:hypothetical protein